MTATATDELKMIIKEKNREKKKQHISQIDIALQNHV